MAAAVKKEFGVDVSHDPNKKAASGRAPPQNHAVPALARPIWRADDGAGRGRRAVPCCYAGNSIINWDRDFFVMDESGKKARRV
ncbi:hypothetical protein CN092_35400 [Sinorhizobium meliloti]|nr:hypothetical protein CN092_35400 [Sinorhizobium meliloti]